MNSNEDNSRNASSSKLPNYRYQKNRQHRNEPNRSETKQSEECSQTSGLKQINRRNNEPREENKIVVVVTKLPVPLARVRDNPRGDNEWQCESRCQVGSRGDFAVGGHTV